MDRLQGDSEVNSAATRVAFSNSMCRIVKTYSRTIIKELGSSKRDGQYVLGWTNGTEGAFSTSDALDITWTTCSLTLMFMGMPHHS